MSRPLIAVLMAATLAGPPLAQAQQSQPIRCSADTPEACLNGVSSTVTGFDSLRVSSASRRMRPEDEGETASLARAYRDHLTAWRGESEPIYGAWLSYLHADYEGRTAAAPYQGRIDSLLLGLDQPAPELSGHIGLLAGFERRRTDTRYNGGGEDGDGWSLSLYGIHALAVGLSVDWLLGYGRLEIDQTRIDPQSTPGDPQHLRAELDVRRWQAATSVLLLSDLAPGWPVATRAGLLYARDKDGGYVEEGGPSARTIGGKQVELLQGHLGVELSRALSALEPHAYLGYRLDLSRDDGADAGGLPAGIIGQRRDRDEAEAGIGLRYRARDVSLSAEWMRTFARKDFRNDSLQLLLRGEFGRR